MGNDQAKEERPPPPNPLFDHPWRPIKFEKLTKESMMDEVRSLTIRNSEVKHLRILIHGPVGTGKSSFINSIDSIFQGRMAQGALPDAMSDKSFTTVFTPHKVRDGDGGSFLPFIVNDIMGLESSEGGARVEDLKLALEGHLKDNYAFNPTNPLKKGDAKYNSNPTLADKVHCLVSVLPADKVQFLESTYTHDVINKLRDIRKKATELNIPQVILLTKVDDACPKVGGDLKLIYRSKKIKEKMQESSNKLGVPLQYIFPIKNYHEEIDLNINADILLLSALKSILYFANDHVAKFHTEQK